MTIESLRALLTGRYTIERELGRGGMGIVYLARDLALDRHVALKVLPPESAAPSETRERFLREARTAAQLSHPNIVPIFHAEAIHDVAFFAMGYVEGENLGERLRSRGALPAAEVVRYLREVAWALAYAHARGVIHRDVKPENLLLERGTGRMMVTDFGIARDTTRADGLTKTGNILGSVHYMSPEQVAGSTLDGRSDLYALGVVGFHLLSGRLPFESDAATAVLLAHATRPAPPLASIAPGVPRSVAAVIDACLAKDPAARPLTGEVLAELLGSALARAEHEAAAATVPATMLSEGQAAALWQRAAQLQADALRRLESRDIAPGLALAGKTAPQSATPVDGYRLDHVQAAAAEAGISQQFVSIALGEIRAAQAAGATGRVHADAAMGGWQQRHATKWIGTAERSCAVTRIIGVLPTRVFPALGSVLQQPPFDLALREVVGGHPLDGGVLVFDLPGDVGVMGVAHVVNTSWLQTRMALNAVSVQVTLRDAPGVPGSTEVTMYADLRPGVRANVNTSTWMAAIAGGLGGAGGAAIGVKTLVALGAAGILLPGVAGAALLGVGCIAMYRGLYRGSVTKARGEMGRSLDAVATSLRSHDIFGPLAAPYLGQGAGRADGKSG